MMLNRQIAFLVCTLVSMTLSTAIDAQDSDGEKLRKAVIDKRRGLTSGKLFFECAGTKSGRTFKRTLRVVFSGNAIRVEWKDSDRVDKEVEKVIRRRGEIISYHWLAGVDAKTGPASIDSETKYLKDHDDSRRWIEPRAIGLSPYTIGHWHLLSLENAIGTQKGKLASHSRTKNGTRDIVEQIYQIGPGTFTKVWIDPSDLFIEKIEVSDSTSDIKMIDTLENTRGGNSEFAFPSRITWERMVDGKMQMQEVITAKECDLNVPIADSEFELESLGLPKGKLIVRNTPGLRQGATYWDGSHEVSSFGESVASAIEPTSTSIDRSWLYVSICFLLAAAVLTISWLWRRRGRSA